MQKLELATIDDSEVERVVAEMITAMRAGKLGGLQERNEAELREAIVAQQRECKCYANDVYQVLVRPVGDESVHLSIKRLDKEPIHDWRDLQEIKNQLVGAECEAIELYPAESRRVDSANQYHLWAFTNPSFRLPFGFNTRFVQDEQVGDTKQRKL